jgi:hypothetical protein
MAGLPTKKHLKSLIAGGGVVGAGIFFAAWSAGLLHMSAHPAGPVVAISSVFVSVVGAIVAIVKIRTERPAERVYAENYTKLAKKIEDPERAFKLQIAAQIATRHELTSETAKLIREIIKPDKGYQTMSEGMRVSTPASGAPNRPPPVPHVGGRTLNSSPSSRDDGRPLRQPQDDPPYSDGESSPSEIAYGQADDLHLSLPTLTCRRNR